jgi:hypothetical protein
MFSPSLVVVGIAASDRISVLNLRVEKFRWAIVVIAVCAFVGWFRELFKQAC